MRGGVGQWWEEEGGDGWPEHIGRDGNSGSVLE
jgi:hypothetical protein